MKILAKAALIWDQILLQLPREAEDGTGDGSSSQTPSAEQDSVLSYSRKQESRNLLARLQLQDPSRSRAGCASLIVAPETIPGSSQHLQLHAEAQGDGKIPSLIPMNIPEQRFAPKILEEGIRAEFHPKTFWGQQHPDRMQEQGLEWNS